MYNLTYPAEERKSDETQLPLLRRMLSLTYLLHEITRLKHEARESKEIESVRNKIDSHHDAIQRIGESQMFQGRTRSTSLVLTALYNSVEISFSRNLCPNQKRHAASGFARKIIQISQKLNEFHKTDFQGSPTSPPSTKFWPLPLVMAAIEVDDMVYREWAIDRLKKYEETGGDHYVWSRKFVEAVCAGEDKTGTRLDWESIISEIKDGLVI